MRKSGRIIPVVLILSIFYAFPGDGSGKDRNDCTLLPRWWERPHVIRKIELTQEQISKIKEIHREESKNIGRMEDDLKSRRGELERMFVQSDLDDREIERRMEMVQWALSALVRAEMDMDYRMLGELSQEQREKLVSLSRQKPEKHKKRYKPRKDKRYNRF